MAIEIGDLVRLRGGTTVMVVSHFSDDRVHAKCLWQNVGPNGMEPMTTNYPVVVLDQVQSGGDAGADAGDGSRRSSWLGSRN